MEWREPVSRSIVSLIVSMAVLVLLVGLVGLLARNVKDEMFQRIVGFIDANVWLMVVIILLYCVVDLLRGLGFPAAYGLPLVNASAGLALVAFVLRIYLFLDGLLLLGFADVVRTLAYWLCALVFVILLLTGYVPMLREKRRYELYSRQV